jgi:hypothetical protein
MKLTGLLGLIIITTLAFANSAAVTASATEPSGILYLPGEEGPVTAKGTGKGGTISTAGLLKTSISATSVKVEAEIGKGEGTHSTLGNASVTLEGVRLGKISCSSENIKGEKAAKETVVAVKEDGDGHAASLLNGAQLVAGIVVGLLELVEGAKKLDLTVNCGGVKILALGALFFAVQKASATSDVTEVGIAPTSLTCDSADQLCKTEFAKWGATALVFNETTKKDELVTCPTGAAAFIKEAEECALLTVSEVGVGTLSKMALIDF